MRPSIAMLSLIPTLALSLAPVAIQVQEPVYPEGVGISRALTPAERAWMAEHPDAPSGRAATPPPTGPLHCAAEYEPMDGILMAWEGTSGQNTVLAKMAKHITTTGNAKVYCVVDTTSEMNSASNTISNQGADMSRVEFLIRRTDTIWIRDYGPRYVYQGDCRAVIDHDYNRPRSNDNAFPNWFAGDKNQAYYDHDLEHGGGNFHLDALGYGYATKLIRNENPNHSEAQIKAIFQDFQALDLHLFDAFPTSVDSTQHLDMWMQICADDTVVISDWPAQSGSAQDNICDSAATFMANRGYNVVRTPARRTSGWSGNHYTYTNVVMCNDIVIIPSYTNSSVSAYNSQALTAWQQACPTKTIIQVNADAVVSYAGVLHCIAMHVPAHRGGMNPTAYLVTPNQGTFSAGDQVDVEWISDDDVAVASAQLEFSDDGGNTWSLVAQNLAAAGTYSWTVPSVSTQQGALRVVVSDAQGNLGEDSSDSALVIGGGGPAAQWVPYGAGKAGTLGVPQIGGSALPILGSNLSLQVSHALPNGNGWIIGGPQPKNGLFDGGPLLVDHRQTFAFTTNASGLAQTPASVPNDPSLAGFSFYLQAWIPNDPQAAGQGWSCSAGLEAILGF
ncbi:MAG: agmatine deiminase family protein [Planctomycetes bacterium]|nr:agmatine deiminase family protein [Planctomycetota bacterium]